MTKADELRKLVADLQSRCPQEVMGQAATSSLFGSITVAATIGVGFILAFTVAVFFISGPTQTKETASTGAANQSIGDESATAQAADAQSAGDIVTGGEKPKSDTEKAIEQMGIGETKDPDTDGKSLENRLDDLLEGIE